MKLSFLKVDVIKKIGENTHLFVPAGGIQFQRKDQTFSLAEPVEIVVDHQKHFSKVNQVVEMEIYRDEDIKPQSVVQWNLFSIVTNENVENELLELIDAA